jgi:hypothetical protein
MIPLALWLFSARVISNTIVWVLSVLIKLWDTNTAKNVDGLKPWIKTAFSIFPIGGLEVANWLIPAHPDDKVMPPEPEVEKEP